MGLAALTSTKWLGDGERADPGVSEDDSRLGIMGGTFDPVHFGHLVTAEEALVQFNLDRVVFMPTGSPRRKTHRVVTSGRATATS